MLAVLTLPGPLVVRLHNYSGLDDANSVTDFDVVLTLLEDIVQEAMCDGKVHCMRSMRAASRCRQTGGCRGRDGGADAGDATGTCRAFSGVLRGCSRAGAGDTKGSGSCSAIVRTVVSRLRKNEPGLM